MSEEQKENKTENIDSKEQKEVVEAELVEAEVVSPKEVQEPIEVEEVSDPGITRTMNISEATYVEFFNRNGMRGQLKTSIYLIIVVWIVLYLLRGEMIVQQYLLNGAIYTAAFLAISIGVTFLTSRVLVRRNYKKSNLGSLQIEVRFNNQGITQSIQDQSARTSWEEISKVDETDISLFFYSGRRAIILSKDQLQFGDIDFIRGLAKSHLGEDAYHVVGAKKTADSCSAHTFKEDKKDHKDYDDEIK
jgi:hypothetical protein